MKTYLPIRQQLKVFSIVILFSMSCLLLHAQNPLVKQWDKRFGGTGDDYFTSFQQTMDGGYILAGYSRSENTGDKTQVTWGADDYWIIKIDSVGIKQWDKQFGAYDVDFLYSIEQTTDGGYILGGSSRSEDDGDKTQPSIGDYDYWIIKIDSIGNKEWDKDFGGTGDDELSIIHQTFDGGYLLGGSSQSDSSGDKTQPSKGDFDYWIIKIDSLGNKLWDNDFGGNDIDFLRSLQETYDKGYILGGTSASGINGDKTMANWGLYDYWIVKVDSFGNKQWDKDFGGSDNDNFCFIQQTFDGSYILGGLSYSTNNGDKTQPSWGGEDYWVLKIDSLGNKEWDKDFGGDADESNFGSISQTLDGGYLMAGGSHSQKSGDKSEDNLGLMQTWIIKTDSFGNKEWDKTLHTNSVTGKDENSYAIQTKDGCYAIANCTVAGIGGDKTQPNWDTIIANYTYDYWIIKFCDTTLTTSINENPISTLQLPISIGPNPNTGNFTVTLNTSVSKDFSLHIINAMGQTIYKRQLAIVNGQSLMVNLSNAAKGLYVAEVINDGKVYRARFIVE